MIASHQGRLFGFIRSLVGPGNEVEDILQNVNRVVVENEADFEIGTNFRAWIFQIARYQVMQHRDASRRNGEHVPFSDALMETLAVRVEEKDSAFARRQTYLGGCLAKLSDRQREVVELRYFERRSVNAIAEMLEMQPNGVSQLLFRARENLLQCIEQQLGNPALHSLVED